MGNYLSYPSLSQKTEQGKSAKYLHASCEMQGWRLEMEDAHAAELDLDQDSPGSSNAFFAVYDGHGGSNCAKYCGPSVHKKLLTEPAYQSKSYPEALKRAFLDVDEDLKARFVDGSLGTCGCTAVASLITSDNRIFVANAGDSRAVLSCDGTAKDLSHDHKPNNETEYKRITAAQGFLRFGRVCGNLALSRALGDFEYKCNAELSPEAQIITCDPEITEHIVAKNDEFLIIACDGIWDCLSSQQAVDSVRYLISEGHKLPAVCERLLDHIVAPDTDSDSPVGCDNMTILVVALLNGRTEDQWYAWVAERAAQNQAFRSLPKLYADYRVTRFQARKRAMAEKEAAAAANPTAVAPDPAGERAWPPLASPASA